MLRLISRALAVSAITATIALGTAAPALAAPAADEPTVLTYTGTEKWTSADSSGEEEVTLTLTCTGDTCVATGLDAPDITLNLANGQAEATLPDSGDPCAYGSYKFGFQLRIWLTEDTMKAIYGTYWSINGGNSVYCPTDDPNITEFKTYTGWSAVLLADLDEGDPCDVSPDVCVEELGDAIIATPARSSDRTAPFHAVGGLDVGTASELARQPADPAAPSSLAGLPAIQSTSFHPIRLFAAGVFALLATGILTLSMLASTAITQSGGSVIGQLPWVKAIGKPLRRARDGIAGAAAAATAKGLWVTWLAIAATYVVAILLSALIDPGAGSAGTGRMLLSLLLVFAIQSVIGWAVIRAILGRGGESVEFSPHLNPGMLLVIVAAVVVGRLLDFEPGIVYGALLGLTFGATLRGTRQAKVILVGTLVVVSLSVLSWVIYSIGVALGLGEAGFGGVLVLETLSALVIAGASGLAVALLPHKALDGKVVWDWNRIIWILVYAGGAFYALVVLGLLPLDIASVSAPFLGWVALYAGYGLITLVVWLLARRAAKPVPPPAAASEAAATTTAGTP